ncbi:hypothetical protein BDB00DRAFT_927947 [Zychaea mexicana]|uniref:uncharacterized protein n=1 Tax=Zychaea mexicana TaxID=64656 RepID=UPI0022FEA915|nr:uncharacterized protein BDB00DRAFT_927947 [Zychaea mexicana]KAI9494745.1 hypothetical protein BDB00DRAFT_927947 [Zychaea mexicana]
MYEPTTTRSTIGFMDALPFDIVSEIFSYLTQDDCIKSMSVSKSWYERVPIYCTHLWRTVELLPGDRHKRLKNQRFLQCLGPHVRKAVLSASSRDELSMFLATLLEYTCDIQSIVFRRCNVVHQDVYQVALQPFSSTLRELSFEDHPYRLSPIHMMASCPNLTHYTYHFSDRPDYHTYSRVSSKLLPDTLQLSIKYLCLNTGSYSDFRLGAILQHCPQLRCLVVNQSVPTTFDLDMCSRLCPELECLGFHGAVVSQQQGANWEAYARRCGTRRSRGLRHFISAEIGGYGARQMVPFLKKHQDTLKSVRIAGNYRIYDEEEKSWSGLQAILAEHLESVHLTGVVLPNQPLGTFLRRSEALNQVVLDYEQTDFDDDVADALAALPRLRKLAVNVKKPSVLTTWASNNTTLLGFKRLLAAPNRLKELSFGGNVLVDDEIIDGLKDLTSLRRLELDHSECYGTSTLSAEGIFSLANCKSGSALQSLTLRNVSNLTDDTLLSLSASMGSLKRLVLSGCNGITKTGLSMLIDNNQTTIQELLVSDCTLVSENSTLNLKNGKLTISYNK